MTGSKVEGFQGWRVLITAGIAGGKALAVADDPMAVQWKGRAAQIVTWQQQSGEFEAPGDLSRPTGYTWTYWDIFREQR